jgi:transketolase
LPLTFAPVFGEGVFRQSNLIFKMLKEIQSTGNKDTRSGFGDGIVEAARKNSNIVALTADLAGSLKLQQFIKEFPQRYFQCGIAEANMIGIAAGLTIGGKIPYTTTFANFSTGRVYDQIRQSVAYSGKNVKICASHAGLTLGEDGATHQILEDIGMMKMLPGMTVIVPCDYNQTKAATMAIADYVGPVYLRFGRPVWPIFTNATDFKIGKAQLFSEGTDVSIFACGHMVWNAIQSGAILQEKGVSVEVINIHTIKPLDEEAIIKSLRKTRCAVTVEEHNIIGGLGDAIGQIAARHLPTPIEYVGTKDSFGESGKPTELLKKYGLDVPDIVAAAEKVLSRKNNG